MKQTAEPLIFLPLSPSQALSRYPFPHLFVGVSDTSYSASYKICQTALLILMECRVNRHVNKLRQQRRAEEASVEVTKWSKNRGGGLDDSWGRPTLATPTPGTLKHGDKQLLHTSGSCKFVMLFKSEQALHNNTLPRWMLLFATWRGIYNPVITAKWIA